MFVFLGGKNVFPLFFFLTGYLFFFYIMGFFFCVTQKNPPQQDKSYAAAYPELAEGQAHPVRKAGTA
jgi:hypothetical protein